MCEVGDVASFKRASRGELAEEGAGAKV